MTGTNQPYSFLESKKFILFIILLYVAIELVYGLWNNSTWDDDCPSRYYNTLNSIHDFKQFVSLWNRPLFVLIFFLPVQISKYSILILMVAISAIASYFLYKGVQKSKTENAWLVIPLMLFQVFYFGVSRNGEVEPLAVAILCFGFYLYVNDRLYWFAIVGSLLPLARLELSPALIIWALILIQKNKFKYVLILAVPTLIWSLLGSISEGHFNIFWLVEQVMNGEKSENIYGHQPFSHYFQRYSYVLGPVIFALFFIGLAERLYKRKIDLFIVSQFVIIFFIYVLFSWKFNAGNSAGFLRNLIPLTPLAAILSLNGFNYLMGLLQKKKNQVEIKPESDSKPVLQKGNKYYKKKFVKTHSSAKQSTRLKTDKYSAVRFGFYILILVVLFYFFFSWKLIDHNSFGETRDFKYILTLLFAVLIFGLVRFFFRKDGQKVQFYCAIITAIFCVSFSIVTEHPAKYLNSERRLQEEFSDLYVKSYLKNYKIYANHIWFFWSNDLNRNDTIKYGYVTKENLNNAPYSSFVLWENHYSSRLSGDVDYDWIKNNKDFIDLYFEFSKDKSSGFHLFQKVHDNKDSVSAAYSTFIQDVGKKATTFMNRGKLNFEKYQKYDEGLKDLNTAVEIDSNLAEGYYLRGYFNFNIIQDYKKAMVDFIKAYEKDTNYIEALYNKGLCLGNLDRLEEAINVYSKIITKDSTFKDAYLKRATIFYTQNKFTQAIDDYTKMLQYEPNNIQSIINRGLSYFNLKNYQNAIYDLSQALNMNVKDASLNYYRANSLYSLGNYKSAIEDYTISINAMPNKAEFYYERGLCLYQLSDFKNSFIDFKKAFSLGYPVPTNLISQSKSSGGF